MGKFNIDEFCIDDILDAVAKHNKKKAKKAKESRREVSEETDGMVININI